MKIVEASPLNVLSYMVLYFVYCHTICNYGVCSFMLYVFCMLLPMYMHCCSSQLLFLYPILLLPESYATMLSLCASLCAAAMNTHHCCILYRLHLFFHSCKVAIACSPHLQVATVCHVLGLKPGRVIWVMFCPGQVGLT